MAPKLEPLGPCTSNSDEDAETESSDNLPDVLLDPRKCLHYTFTAFLGKGGFARCYSATDSVSSKEVALKIVSKSRLTKHSELEKMRKEIAIHETLNHPNIVKLLNHFEDTKCVYMVLELCHNSSLLYRIQYSPGGRLNNRSARLYMMQIVDAVTYLHEQVGILHRDLKPSNILLNAHDQVKLADFGLAIKFTELSYSSLNVCGTPNYLSPQILKREGHSKESEAWSIGCILYCMLVGKPPFETDSLEKTYAKIASCDYSFPLKQKISSSAEDLISKLLNPNAVIRMKIGAIKHHPYLSKCKTSEESYLSTSTTHSQISKNEITNKCLDEYYIYDSIYGSNGYLYEQPRSMVDCYTFYQKLVAGHYNVSDETPPVVDFQLNMVSKWVDYTNKYGFGCVLSDNTHCALFIDHVSLSYSHVDEMDSFRYLMITDVRKDPWMAYDWTSHDIETKERFSKRVRLAEIFSRYMDRELQPVYEHSVPRQQLDALVYHKRRNGVLLMFLAKGTIQINFVESHEKLVISRDRHGRVLFAAIDGSFGCRMYQLLPQGPIPTRPDCQKVQQLLNKALKLLEAGTLKLLGYSATQC